MSDDMVGRIADYLLNAGCGDSEQCEQFASDILRMILEPSGFYLALSQFPDLERE